MKLNGSQILIECLKEQGVDTVFGYPGGCILNVYDELYKHKDEITHILTSHEQGASHAADGYARATGKVGVCFATSGPGATNLVTGIATAYMDSIPIVAITCNVGVALLGKDSFQEIDIAGITMPITKHNYIVKDVKKLAETIRKAFVIAKSGRPGPVLIDLPKDIQTATGPGEYPKSVSIRGYKPNESVHIGQLKKGYKLLKAARKPLFLVGGGVNIARANEKMLKLVEQTRVPVVTTIMGKGAIPTGHPYYIGNSGMHGKYAANIAVGQCDVLFSIGTRFNDRITGDLNEFAPKAKIVHIDIDTAAISRNVVVDVPIVADARLALQKLNEWAEPKNTRRWIEDIRRWDQENPLEMRRDKGMTPQMIMEAVNEVFDSCVITTDVGQHQMWAAQYLEINEGKQFITSGGLGTMGFGFPAAI